MIEVIRESLLDEWADTGGVNATVGLRSGRVIVGVLERHSLNLAHVRMKGLSAPEPECFSVTPMSTDGKLVGRQVFFNRGDVETLA